jgi:uncharacterized protein YlxW (UPF0749 family)
VSPEGGNRIGSGASHVPAVDASMDLLNQIVRQSVDPDYALVSARGDATPGRRWPLALVALVIGAMFVVSALQTTRTAPAVAVERAELISRITVAGAQQDELRARATALSADNDRLRTAALGTGSEAVALESQIDTLDPIVGNRAVTGPGLVITVDDAPSADQTGRNRDVRDRVLDVDLRTMVNGLWLAGAEAIAINGHRLSALTAIRGAGEAITVDYRSLTRPYLVEAIGDAKTLQAHYVESAGGAWWNGLAQNRGMRYDISSATTITLSADPGMVLHYAKRAR